MSEVKYRLAAGTNMGLVRTNNEDNFVVCPDLNSSDWRIPQVSESADLGPYGTLLVVADGMGGANAGEVASAIAVETIQDSFTPTRLEEVVKDENAVQDFMKEVVKAADLRIFKKSKEDSTTRGMGTTVVMAWILDKRVYVCWCGDSRCYMLNKHKGLVRLSKDHSYVQELIDRGELDPDLAMDHPYSNVITRCLGDMENRAVPDTRVFQLHNGDTILLCSDGLSGLCNDLQILDLLIKFRDNPEECKNELIAAALNEGGHDNVTVALCNIEIPDEKEDVEDDALPKGTLPPVIEKTDLSETLPTGEASHPSPRKGFPWKMLLLLVIVAALAFAIGRWLKNEPNVQEEPTAQPDTTAVVPITEPQPVPVQDVAIEPIQDGPEPEPTVVDVNEEHKSGEEAPQTPAPSEKIEPSSEDSISPRN